jgi:hypothetical protein
MGGVAIFVKKAFEKIERTKGTQGEDTTLYGKGYNIILGGIYGLSINSDRLSAEIF